ncbi:MAG: hypothetical protein LUQ57_04760 [Methylococcaceae bacterium]|nr:hypothetical protein [Methylococcaceae bacterium]
MKTAFYLVLLANLTLLMYEYHRGAFDQVAEAPAPDVNMLREPIVLVGEQEGGQQSATQTALAQTNHDQDGSQKPEAMPEPAEQPLVQQKAEPASFVCYEAGPFANEQILKTWSKEVNEVQGDVKPLMKRSQEIIGYLVLYPTAGRHEDIKSAMQVLRDRGIRDAYPLAAGEYMGYISLGAFRRETQAARMQEDLQGRGVEGVVKPRFKEAELKYALFTGLDDISGRLSEMKKKYPNIQLKALPDTDPNCFGHRPEQSDSPVAELTESGAGPAVSMESHAQKSDATAPSGSVAGAENTSSKADKPGIEILPTQREQNQKNDAADAGTTRLTCYEAGPFPNEQSLSVWQKRVAGAKGLMKPIFRDDKALSDYLVLYPSSGGAEETTAALQLLRQRGFNDAWPLSAGDDKGQISLGVFNREENALQMQKSLLDKGVNSVVKPRYKSKRQKYALIAGSDSISASLQELEKSHSGIKLRRMPDNEPNCPQ